MSDAIEVHPLTVERRDDYLAFFDARAFTDNPEWSGCYCFFPYHDPQSGPWGERAGAANREAISACIGAGEAQGFLAYADGEVVGWCNAAPRALYPSMRGLPGDAATTGCLPCFIVAPEWRGKQVASRLLAAAVEGMREAGMTIVIAKPVKGSEAARDHAAGPLSMYEAAGFEIVGEDPQGNVFVQKRLVA